MIVEWENTKRLPDGRSHPFHLDRHLTNKERRDDDMKSDLSSCLGGSKVNMFFSTTAAILVTPGMTSNIPLFCFCLNLPT